MSTRVRTVLFTERVPARDAGRGPLLLTLALTAAYLALVADALVPSPVGFLAASVAVAVAELVLLARAPFPVWILGRIGAGGPTRGLARGVAVVVLLAREDLPQAWLVVAALALVAVHALRAAGSALAEVSRLQRKMPVVARGLDLAPLRVPPAPPVLLARRSGETLALTDLALTVGTALAVVYGSSVPLGAGVAVAVLMVLVGDVLLLRAVLAMRRVPRRDFVAAVSRALDAYAPEVALYLGSGPDTLYQVEMWVETLERLDRPAVLVLRDRESLARLGPTRLPVVCVEHGNVLMALDMPSLRLALYVSHATTNLHLLRRRGVTHVFIGHGDSDKPSSVNPFLKAYDEIWVSGPAAHDRFAAAGLGLAVRYIAEVGRPQLRAETRDGRAGGGDRPTVLYAPTWEGYGDEPWQTSLDSCGLALVRMLLEHDVRVLYRPHPLVGTRDPAVARAHRALVGLLGDREPALPADWPDHPAAAWDDLALADVRPTVSRTERVEAMDAWARDQLRVVDGRGLHRLVPGPPFGLRVCFDAADVLLADVSSVVSDFVSTGKPYAVTNPGRLQEDEFTARYPSIRGGYLVRPDGHGLLDLLDAGRGLGDPAAAERAVLRERLLGPDRPSGLERMRGEVDRVVTGGLDGPRAPSVVPAPGRAGAGNRL